jgi:hypothetical protein
VGKNKSDVGFGGMSGSGELITRKDAEKIMKSVVPDANKAVARDLVTALFPDAQMAIEALSPLARRLYEGETYTDDEKSNTRGRPTKIGVFEDGEWFTVKEIEAAEKEMRHMIASTPLRRAGALLTDEEYNELLRLALPELKLRQLALAMMSDNLKEVTQVVNSFEDRVMGKATQAVQLVDPNKDIRRGWVIDVTPEIDNDNA